MIPTAEQLKNFFSGTYYHPVYEETVTRAAELRMHADGEFPTSMIDERRPNESEHVQAYRKKIWKPITKPHFNKVMSSLQKIRRSSEWNLRWPGDTPARISPAESLESYLMYHFPHFTSITNWAFELLLKEYAVDANSWIVVMPMEEVAQANRYSRPYPTVFRSEQIIDVETDALLVVKRTEQIVYVQDNVQHFGDSYFVITDEVIQRWDQSGKDRTFTLASDYRHGLGYLPAFQMKGVVSKSYGNQFLKESRLAPMLPRFDEALREYSDLQAEVVLHIFSEKWEYGQDECGECKGKRYVQRAGLGSQKEECYKCNGSGYEPRGPYSTYKIAKPMAGEVNAPTPPVGYVQKDTNIVTTQDSRIERHIWHGLSAINMEFLAEKPLTESGVAKAYDADETNNFVHSVAEDIVAMLDNVAMYINDFRYALIMPDADARRKMLPSIAVPERFDIFSAQMVQAELTQAKTSKINPVLISAMETQFASMKFAAQPEVRDRLLLILKLDPLSNIPVEDKMVQFSNGWVSKIDCAISANIGAFIQRALEEKSDAFYSMPLKAQQDTIRAYAQEMLDSESPASIILGDPETGAPIATSGNALKDSVGGLTGMIDIAKAVAAGLYDLEAAIALVSDRFGITEEEARKQLGTPQISGQQQIEKVVELTK